MDGGMFHPLAEGAPQASSAPPTSLLPPSSHDGKTSAAKPLLAVEKVSTVATSTSPPCSPRSRMTNAAEDVGKSEPERRSEEKLGALNSSSSPVKQPSSSRDKEFDNRGDNSQSSTIVDNKTIGSACDAIRHLPRTIQWKIQWNLLDVSSFGKRRVDQNHLAQINKERIFEQRQRADSLLERHIWDNSPFRDVSSAENSSRQEETLSFQNNHRHERTVLDSATSRKTHDNYTVDREEESQSKGKIQKMKFKDGAAFDDPLSGFAQNSFMDRDVNEESNDDNDQSQSQWREFYSNREMIDLIYKDLNRLSPRLLFWDHDTENENDEQNEAQDDEDNQKGEQRDAFRTERIKLLADLLFGYAKEHPSVGYRQGMHEILAYVFLAFELDYASLEVSTLNVLARETICDPATSSTNDGGENSNESSSHTEHVLATNIPPLLLSRQNLRADAYIMFEAWMEGLKPAYQDSNNCDTNELQARGGTVQMGQRILTLTSYASADIHQILVRITEDMGAPPQMYCAKWMRLLFCREITARILVLQLWDAMLDILFDPWHILWHTASLQHRIRTAMISHDDADAVDTQRIQDDSEGEVKEAAVKVNSSLCLMDIIECAACSMILLQRRTLSRMGRNNSPQSATHDHGREPSMHDCLNLLMNYPAISDISELRRMTTRVTRFHLESKLGIIIPRQSVSRAPKKQNDDDQRRQEKLDQTMVNHPGFAVSHEQYRARQGPSSFDHKSQHNIRTITPIDPLRQEQNNQRQSFFDAGVSGHRYAGVASTGGGGNGGGGAFLSKMGVFLDGAKATAANALASMEERLNQTTQFPSQQQQYFQHHTPYTLPDKSMTTALHSSQSSMQRLNSGRLPPQKRSENAAINPRGEKSTEEIHPLSVAPSAALRGRDTTRVSNGKSLTEDQEARSDKLDQLHLLSFRMGSNLSIIRSFLVQSKKPEVAGNIRDDGNSEIRQNSVPHDQARIHKVEPLVPQDVLEALQQLEQIQQNLALLGSKRC